MSSLNGLFIDLAKKERCLWFAVNHEYQETDSINSVQSSLKSHPLRITLYTPPDCLNTVYPTEHND